MLFSGPFAFVIIGWFNVVVVLATLILDVLAFVNCATRRAEAFPVVGRLTKGTWMLITGGALVVTVATGFGTVAGGGANFLYTLLIFAALAAVLIYLLDIRPALRDVIDGRGGW